jgi:hypothetical protein
MKKYVISLFILGLFFLGAGSAKAVSMSDLQNEIKSLSERISILESKLLEKVIVSSGTSTIVAPTTAITPVTTTVSTTPVLTKGVKSTEVAQIQTALRNQGYTIVADGSFGAKTEEAVKAFQASKGLSVTGKVDSQTRNSLINNSVQTRFPVSCDPNVDSAPWIRVLSPNGGETFTAGQRIIVKWESCNLPANSTIIIGLSSQIGNIQGATSLAYNINNSDGEAILVLPTLAQLGSNSLPGKYYKIYIVYNSSLYATVPGFQLKDFSDDTFTIN